ncbi:ABC transporter permease [Boudabousia tangfeifanii]|uniref:ABC transporter permease n=1 Tax=Boudabousia tangfeifanii TaxID=1912795 RepID=A0A1D9MKU2_9ACTO|nr:amino acid ABC transporter permease [Boudabousia tangfeifanii]AOZ72793.1 ABC transporter permease [Boudabousia tangfeifanii]
MSEPKFTPLVIKSPPSWGRVVSAIIVALLAAMLLSGLITNPNYHWDLVWKWLFAPTIIKGVLETLKLTVLAMVLGVILAVTAAIMRKSKNPITRGVAWAYIWFFRGTPIYTQLIFWGLLPSLYQQISLGIPFGPQFFHFDTQTIFTAVVCAVVGLGLNEGAYLAEIVRSGLDSVDPGQAEAARALGLNGRQIMWRIILPQAMRVIVPPTGNETISMLKTTSLVVAIPVTTELTYAASRIGQRLYQPLPLLIVAAFWYLLITSILMVGQYYLEAYFGRGQNGDEKQAKAQKSRRLPLFTSRKQQAINEAKTTKDDPFLEYTP